MTYVVSKDWLESMLAPAQSVEGLCSPPLSTVESVVWYKSYNTYKTHIKYNMKSYIYSITENHLSKSDRKKNKKKNTNSLSINNVM